MNNNFRSMMPVIFAILIFSSILLTVDGTTLTSEDVAGVDESSNSLPPSFCWRDIDGVDYTTTAKAQAGNSCEAFSLVAALETMIQYKISYPFGCDLSEAHLFLGSGGARWGTYLEDAADFLVKYGVPDQSCCPFPDDHWDYDHSFPYEDWKDRSVKIEDWKYTDGTPSSIKENLTKYGPVVTYIHVYYDLWYLTDCSNRYIYEHKWGRSFGPHYVTIVGYNDNPGYWICKNNWGTEKGCNGFFNIYYGECNIGTHSIYLINVTGIFPIKFVDGDNKEGPWNGTKEYPYRKIQDGINNSCKNYTVRVLNGKYHENLIINRTITLTGENRTSTVIDGQGKEDVVFVTADGVKINNFTVQNSGNETFDSGIKIRLYGNANAVILNNIIQDNRLGIYLYTSFGCTIKNNKIHNNSDDGIHLFYSLDESNILKKSAKIVQILKNLKDLAFKRLEMYFNSSFRGKRYYDNFICNNIVQNNRGDGIELEYSARSLITKNKVCNNNGTGILLRDGSNYNRIRSNNIKGNIRGVYISESFKNRIICNNFINNKVQAYFCNSFFNQWSKNYWNRPRFLPKLIQGHNGIQKHPYNVDWAPSKKLNDV